MPTTPRDRSAPGASDRNPPCSAATLFDELWNAMTDVMGPTATAALLERSIARAVDRADLSGIVISRQQLKYSYKLPDSWQSLDEHHIESVRLIVGELVPLLTELTGTVIVRRLFQMPELKRCRAFEGIQT